MTPRSTFALALGLGVAVAGCSAETLDAGSTQAKGKLLGKPTTRATFGAMIDAFTMDETTLYFTCEDGWVYRLEKKGDAPPERIAKAGAPGSLYTEGIAVDDVNVYWTALGDGLEGGAVLRAPKAGGAAVTIAPSRARPWGIAVDDRYIYWADQGAAPPPINSTVGGIGKGSLLRLAKSGGEPEVLARRLHAPDFIALDGIGGVVWHEGAAVQRLTAPGAKITTVLARSVVFRTTNIVIVDGLVSWADEPADEASVWRASPSGDVVALAGDVDTPAALATFGSGLFWNVATGAHVGAVFGVVVGANGAEPIAAADAHGDKSQERALFLLADEHAFYSVESWSTTHLELAIRVVAR